MCDAFCNRPAREPERRSAERGHPIRHPIRHPPTTLLIRPMAHGLGSAQEHGARDSALCLKRRCCISVALNI
ncbi:hypothetical protein M5D96_002487 [Drosophila gunungcola]|uniref:Uncharacterized protein n=1 Tax=Drosophila gunungcola TaxID=103775 RepID=A0A9P9Z015_9MUSC|nr:hypothetical protein M5D96_002487 [Drosophila gunungcola]